ncbi:protein arginine N-methyltransferase 9-like isoform X2 [Neocloeon triangulifer]|nr:protein arginine N-methyltransferase 9-like isoform X2 [Neocloeon triangulifer]
MGHLVEAKEFFEKALSAKEDYLPAAHNLENLASAMVERWHFRMLNDTVRNESYREAIFKKIRQGFSTILDLGTGTSLLSLYAMQGGAKKIFACENSPAMIEIAKDVIKYNDSKTLIQLIPLSSTDLQIPQNLPSRVSLLVTETMDAGVFGENILQSLIDAWDRLLLPPTKYFTAPKASSRNGIVVPFGATIFVAGVQCPFIANSSHVLPGKCEILEALPFKVIASSALENGEYSSEDLTRLPGGFKLLTEPVEVLKVNFNDPDDLKKHLNGERDKTVDLMCSEPGVIDAFVSWFVLQLDEDLKISTKPCQQSCWEQAVFATRIPLVVESNQKVKICISSAKGVLNVQLDAKDIEIDSYCLLEPDAIRFLNDRAWISAMHSVANNMKATENSNVLDLSPFPYLGLLMLKKGVCKSLTTLLKMEDACKDVFGTIGTLRFIQDIEELNGDQIFDVVILSPCSQHGEIDQEAMHMFGNLRNHMTENCILLPEKITVVGQLWESQWLNSMSRLTSDENVTNFRISEFVNKYKLKKHLDLSIQNVQYIPLSEPQQFHSFELCQLPDSLTCVDVKVLKQGTVDALAYWFEFDFGGTIHVTTNRPDSHLLQAAYLFHESKTVSEGDTVVSKVITQSGILDICPRSS